MSVGVGVEADAELKIVRVDVGLRAVVVRVGVGVGADAKVRVVRVGVGLGAVVRVGVRVGAVVRVGVRVGAVVVPFGFGAPAASAGSDDVCPIAAKIPTTR